MKQILSRFGGHGFIIGKGKASSVNLPEDQSFLNVLKNHSIEMDGFSFLSSYEMMPEFMGAFDKLPSGTFKIAEFDHVFNEILLQYDIETTTNVYFGLTGYSNVFTCYIKTNFKPLKDFIGQIDSSYDLVLILRIIGKSNDEIDQMVSKILNLILGLLIYEMGINDEFLTIRPSKTKYGKMINLENLNILIKN